MKEQFKAVFKGLIVDKGIRSVNLDFFKRSGSGRWEPTNVEEQTCVWSSFFGVDDTYTALYLRFKKYLKNKTLRKGKVFKVEE